MPTTNLEKKKKKDIVYQAADLILNSLLSS